MIMMFPGGLAGFGLIGTLKVGGSVPVWTLKPQMLF